VTIDRRQINDDRRRVFGTAELIAFVCECADEACARTVQLSPLDFEALRASEHGLVLATEHAAPA
jgi:hypothetical protein